MTDPNAMTPAQTLFTRAMAHKDLYNQARIIHNDMRTPDANPMKPNRITLEAVRWAGGAFRLEHLRHIIKEGKTNE